MTSRTRAALGAAAVLVVAGCGGGDAEPAAAPTPARTTPAPTTSPSSAPAGVDAYRDGTYEAEGTYGGGPSFIGVTLTLDDGFISQVEVATRATDPTSLDLQERFAEAIPDVVVGRPIADLEVGKTAGSSNTPDGFNDALEQIREDAQTD